ncbi:uncharacterized protein [Aegilops tauschii subsp. strangulata]|uniref:uncharacterized protein n=1 Tax=Aegilops tauschii subsp. strangulata TaxID=200361 RepID=UPI000989B27F|nr:uncharacterized protein LOC109763204 [Aegilops tauschii subsp. strangulata]
MRLGLGAGIVLSSPKGDRLKYALQIHFATSTNVAKYEALVHGLWLATEFGIQHILCYGDSDLVVQQCSGEWDAHDSNMASYHFLVQKLSGFFAGCEFLHVLSAENEAADALAKIASSWQSIPSGVSLEHLHKPSVKPSPDSESIHVPPDPAAPQPGPGTAPPDPTAPQPGPGTAPPNPAAPQPEFLENGVLPMDETEARQVQRRASAYSIINNELVKRSSTGVFQRGIEQDKGIEILLYIHQGECGHHAALRSLVAKAFRHGFYRPTALDDVESLILKCEGCQRFGKRGHQPASALWTIPIAWPFVVWGIDMVGPFKTARGGMTPIKKLDGPTTVRFVKDIAVRYGMPNNIITDNVTNFVKGALAQYCSISGICLDLASVAHSWLDELPVVLWSLRTTSNRSSGFTPFFLVNGAEAVIPTDVEFDSPRVTMYTEAEAKEAREDSVDLLEEARLLALSRSIIYQQGLRHYHSKKIKPLAFLEGDLVLRLVQEQTGQHKLSSPWEGPFIVSKTLCDRNAYYLIDARKSNKRKRDTTGEETIRPWNAELLRPFYS